MAGMARRADALLSLLAGSALVLAGCTDDRRAPPPSPAPIAGAPGPAAPPPAAPPPAAPTSAGESIGPATTAADETRRYRVKRHGIELGTIEVRPGDAGEFTPAADSDDAKRVAEQWAAIRAARSFSVDMHVPTGDGGRGAHGSRVYRVGDDDYAEAVHWKLLDQNYEVEVLARAEAADATFPPIDRACTSDADCVLSNLELIDGECCHGCMSTVSNKRWKERASAWCEAHVGHGCPKKRCGSAPPPTCRDGQCSNE